MIIAFVVGVVVGGILHVSYS